MGRPPGRPLPPLPEPDQRRWLRVSNGVTIIEAARELKVGRDTFSKWERGVDAPRPQHHRDYHGLLEAWASMISHVT